MMMITSETTAPVACVPHKLGRLLAPHWGFAGERESRREERVGMGTGGTSFGA